MILQSEQAKLLRMLENIKHISELLINKLSNGDMIIRVNKIYKLAKELQDDLAK